MVEGEFDAIEVLNPGYSFGVVSGGGFGFIGNIGKKCDRAGMPARIAVRIGIDTDELEVRRFYTRFLFEFPPRRLLDGFANLDEPPGKRESALERREFTPDHEHPTPWRDDDTIGGEERSARRRHGYSIYVESGAMKTATSAGLLLYRNMAELQVLLAHPGGPYWQKKDAGAWTIPKGEIEVDEDPFAAALREFGEEMGFQPTGRALPLGAARQAGGKVVQAWAIEADWDPAELVSNTFSIEWPPRSGHTREFQEIDRAAWFNLETARGKILKSQAEFLNRLAEAVGQS